MNTEPNVTTREEIVETSSLASGSNQLTVLGVVVSPRGPVSPEYYYQPSEVASKLTAGTISRSHHTTLHNATVLSASVTMLLVRSLNTKVVNVVDTKGNGASYNLENETLYEKTVPFALGGNSPVPSTGHVRIGNVVFHIGAAPTIANVEFIVWDGSKSNLATIINTSNLPFAMDTDTNLLHFTGTTPVVSAQGVTFTITSGSIDEVEFTGSFLIIPTQITMEDLGPILFTKTSSTQGTLKYDGVTYLISMDENDIDPEDGTSIYFDYINDLGLPFTLDYLEEGFVVDTTTIPVPKALGFDLVECEKPSNMIRAINQLLDQELYTFDLVTDLGFAHTGFYTALCNVGDNNYAKAELSVPSDRKTVAEVIQFRNSTGLDTNNATLSSPNDIDTSLGFKTIITSSTRIIQDFAYNKSINKEFRPTFGLQSGQVRSNKLLKKWTVNERKQLLAAQVMPIAQLGTVKYLVNNVTLTSKRNVISNDEHNRRLANKVNRSVEVIAKKYMAEENTVRTRGDVTSDIKRWFDENILNQFYRPEDVKIVCNEQNNPDALRRENKLKIEIYVKYRSSIKYIEVLNRAYPVGVAFD